MWICFSTVRDLAASFFDCSESQIDMLSSVFLLLYLPFIPAAPYVTTKYQLRTCMLFATTLALLSGLVRFLSVFPSSYAILFGGQCLASLSQVFSLSLPPHISSKWFPSSERPLATGVGVLANEAGIAFGLLLAPVLVHEEDDFMIYLLLQLILAALSFVLCVGFFPNRDNCSSYNTTEKERLPQVSLTSEFGVLSHNWKFWALFGSYGLVTGGFYGWSTFLQLILRASPANISDVTIGWCGFSAVAVGMIGAILSTTLAQRYLKYQAVTVATLAGSLLCMIALYAATFYISDPSIASVTLLLISSVLGIFLTGALSVGVEFAAELFYPVQEILSSGMMFASSQLFGVVFISSLSLLKASAEVVMATLIAALLLATLLALPLPNTLNRRNAEMEPLLVNLDAKEY